MQRTSPPLSVTQNPGGGPVVSWADPATTLQSATNVVGPYTDVLGATSPCNVPAGHTAQFFRTRWQTCPFKLLLPTFGGRRNRETPTNAGVSFLCGRPEINLANALVLPAEC